MINDFSTVTEKMHKRQNILMERYLAFKLIAFDIHNEKGKSVNTKIRAGKTDHILLTHNKGDNTPHTLRS